VFDDDDYNSDSDSDSGINRLYVNREGGRSLLQIEITCIAEVINIA
jgi:hypothetical protein